MNQIDPAKDVARVSTPDFLTGGGDLGALMRALDWSASPLGAPEAWPQSLRSVVGLLLNSKFPMFVAWGAELGFLYNDAYADILGAKHPDALGRRFCDIWAEIWPDISPLVDAAMAGEASYRENLPLVMNRRGFGEQTWFTFSYSPVQNESGQIAGLFCACSETTGQVLAEGRQRFRLVLEERLRDLADPEAIMSTAVTMLGEQLGADRVGYGQVAPDDVSIRLSHCYAVGVEPLLGDFPLDGFGPERIVRQRRGETEVCADVRSDLTQDAAVWAAIDTRAFVSVALVRDGRFRASLFVNARGPRRWTPDEVALVEEVAARTWDAVERARAEARQRELNETLEQRVTEALAERRLLADVFDATGAFIQIVDPTFCILAINKANAEEYQRLYGFRPAAGDNLLDLLAGQPEQRETVRVYFARALAGEAFVAIDEFGDPARETRCYEIKFSPLFGPDSALIGAYHFSLDVTERRREQERLREAEEALRQSQKMEAMGQLTGGVAHDFNNLLTPIIGSLDMLARRGVGSDRERRLIDGALQSADRAKTLVQRLLAFARRQPLQPTAVDVAKLVDGMAGLIGSTLGPTIDVRVNLAADLPPAKADPNQLEMALLNLAVNARDAMFGGGELTIAASRESVRSLHASGIRPGHYVRLCVSDTGAGMDDATRARAVEPFFSTKGVGKGTGLGLSMAHGLAAQLGGGLVINSALGRGTTVELWLPLSASVVEDNYRASDVVLLRNGLGKALLVDDEELVRLSTADMLTDLGYEVVEASSAEEALHLIHNGLVPDLLVTDHLMPGMSGAELAREVKAERPALPVLIVSGYAEAEGIDPDVARLTKPFRNAELAASLSALFPASAI